MRVTTHELENINIGFYLNAKSTNRSDIVRLIDFLIPVQNYIKDTIIKMSFVFTLSKKATVFFDSFVPSFFTLPIIYTPSKHEKLDVSFFISVLINNSLTHKSKKQLFSSLRVYIISGIIIIFKTVHHR